MPLGSIATRPIELWDFNMKQEDITIHSSEKYSLYSLFEAYCCDNDHAEFLLDNKAEEDYNVVIHY